MTHGVRRVTENQQTIEHLKVLEQRGVRLIVCGTCLNYYGLTDKLAVGEVTNMYSIVEKLVTADLVVKP